VTRSAEPAAHAEAVDADPYGEPHARPSATIDDGPRDRLAALRAQLVRPMPGDRLLGWLATLFVGAVAAVLRLVNLGRPNKIVFDETYYAKDAFSLLRFADARKFVDDADELIIAGDLDVFIDEPSFVVHPPAGKWIIAGGIRVFGMEPFGWRVAVAICGVLTAMIVVRAGRRLFRSTLLGSLAGLLLAVDGFSISVSRIALLDGILAMFTIAAFACLLVDRDYARRRYADWSARIPPGVVRTGLGPLLVWRPWRLAAGVLLGLACATKWSGLFAVVVLGLLTVVWEIGARKAAGAPFPWLGSFTDGLVAYVTIVGAATLTYVGSWWGWIVGDNGWSRTWAAENPASGFSAVLPDWVRSLWHYHAEMNNFHQGVSSSHTYESQPWEWLILARPVLFEYTGLDSGEQRCTDSGGCSQTILALGNPLLWWGACAALLVCVWMWLIKRDWRPGAILAGVLATWAPWLLFAGRTTFGFYAATIVPFLVLAVAYVLGLVLGGRDAEPTRRMVGAVVVGAFVLATIVLAAWFYPIHVDELIPTDEWRRRMWFRNWI
jgi:dolichyl-phosphate-mannose-protein mannosyltransferase